MIAYIYIYEKIRVFIHYVSFSFFKKTTIHLCISCILSTDTSNQDAAAAAAAVDSQGNVAQITNATKKLSFKEWKGFQKLDKCSVAAAMELECVCTRCYDVEDYINDNILFNDEEYMEVFNDEEYMEEYMEKYMEWNAPHNIPRIRKPTNYKTKFSFKTQKLCLYFILSFHSTIFQALPQNQLKI